MSTHTRLHANKRSGKKRANGKKANKKANMFVLFEKHFGSGGDENERKMANNVNYKEMIFVIRNLIYVDVVS